MLCGEVTTTPRSGMEVRGGGHGWRSLLEVVMVTSPNSGPCSHGPGGERAAAPEIEQSRDSVLLILARHVSDV